MRRTCRALLVTKLTANYSLREIKFYSVRLNSKSVFAYYPPVIYLG